MLSWKVQSVKLGEEPEMYPAPPPKVQRLSMKRQLRMLGLELEMHRIPPPLLLFPLPFELPPLTVNPSNTAEAFVLVPFKT